ncbi:MAG: L-serine ammonia-lyase, iron-sulfur-dependent, subunit alpha, partial [Fenollaria massiliensis]
MLNTAKEIIEVCESENLHFYDLVLKEETKVLKMTEEEMKKKLQEILDVMKASSHETLDKIYDTEYKMIDGFAKKMNDYQKEKDPLTSKFLVRTMAMAFSTSETNANMGTIA